MTEKSWIKKCSCLLKRNCSLLKRLMNLYRKNLIARLPKGKSDLYLLFFLPPDGITRTRLHMYRITKEDFRGMHNLIRFENLKKL